MADEDSNTYDPGGKRHDAEYERMREFARRLPSARRTRPELVYFILAADAGCIKIGIASDVWMRMSALQTGSPHELMMAGFIRDEHPRTLEFNLHQKFSHLHVRGEWFCCEPELVDYIEANRDCVPEPPATVWGNDEPAHEVFTEDARPKIPPGVEAPAGNSRKARMERYKLARGLSA